MVVGGGGRLRIDLEEPHARHVPQGRDRLAARVDPRHEGHLYRAEQVIVAASIGRSKAPGRELCAVVGHAAHEPDVDAAWTRVQGERISCRSDHVVVRVSLGDAGH